MRPLGSRLSRTAPALLLLLAACPPRNPLSPAATWARVSRIEASPSGPGYVVLLDTITAKASGPSTFEVWNIFQYDSTLVTSDSVRLTAQALRQRLDCKARTVQPLEALRFDTTGTKVVWRGSDKVASQAQQANFAPPHGSPAFAVLVSSCMVLEHHDSAAATQ